MEKWKIEFDLRFKNWKEDPIFWSNDIKFFIEKVRQEAIMEVIDEIPDEVEFLHGVPVSMPKAVKDQLKTKFLTKGI